MNYYVVWPDGRRFGPADLNTLQQWAAEGRLLPSTTIEDIIAGNSLPASSIVGLDFAAAPPDPVPATTFNAPTLGTTVSAPTVDTMNPYQMPPSSSAPYPRADTPAVDGGKDVTNGWILIVVGFLCCCLGYFGAIYFGLQAKQKGNSGGTAVVVVASILTGLSAIVMIGYAVAFANIR